MRLFETGLCPDLLELVKRGSETGRENAAGALRNLATDDRVELELARLGAAGPLCELLAFGSPAAAANAHGALQNLTFSPEARRRVADAFGRPDLAGDAATLRRKLQASVAPLHTTTQGALCGDAVCR